MMTKEFLWRRLFVRRARIIYVIRKVFVPSGVTGAADANCGLACRVLASALERAAGFAGRT